MRKKCIFLTAMAIYLLASCVPVPADENPTSEPSEQQTQQKDECLLLARNRGNSAVSIQEKIERFKEEIAKGRAVYTVEDRCTISSRSWRRSIFLLDR